MTKKEGDQQPEEGFTQIGDVAAAIAKGLFPEWSPQSPPAPQRPKTPPKRASQRAEKLAIAAAEIVAQPSKTEIALMARELVQCNFPHRDPGKVPFWIRKNGDLSLVLQPGVDEQAGEMMRLPNGSIPRLVLCWIITEANRNKNDTKRNRPPWCLEVGETLNKFIRDVGYDPNTGGGKRGDAARIKEQIMRLLNCRISFKYSEGDETKGRRSFLNMEVAAGAQFWWDYNNPDQAGLFKSEIILNPIFYEAITTAPVPLDFRALRALKHSSFALDVYIWATYRVFTLQEAKRNDAKIPLASLREQFGAEYTRLRDFKAAFADALAKVQEVFPALDYTLEKDALVLRNSKVRAVPTRGERPALAQQKAQRMARQISQRAREWFQENYYLHNVDDAFAEFDKWKQGKGIESRDVDAHFKDFVTNHWFAR